MNLVLKSASIPTIGTFGRLYVDGSPFLCTVEREWFNNRSGISCVPAGDYRLEWHESPKYGRALHLIAKSLGVTIESESQRTHCLIHVANWPIQVQGCIAPGGEFHSGKGTQNGIGVTNSASAVAVLEEMIPDDGCNLTIERYMI